MKVYKTWDPCLTEASCQSKSCQSKSCQTGPYGLFSVGTLLLLHLLGGLIDPSRASDVTKDVSAEEKESDSKSQENTDTQKADDTKGDDDNKKEIVVKVVESEDLEDLLDSVGEICYDQHLACGAWKQKGLCESDDHRVLMIELCPVACEAKCRVTLPGGHASSTEACKIQLHYS